ncbi:hypothetical protein OROMI_003426 [Orobanche minor]
MSGRLSGGNDSFLDEDDLAEIRERFKELTKEKEMLRDSKSESFDLIRRLEHHVRAISESREKDKKHIAELERELSNCSQEIDYLQEQLNMRNSDLSCPGDQVCSLQFEINTDTKYLASEVGKLREQLKISDFERFLLMQEIEDKEIAMRYSESRVEKLEESVSSMALEYQCELESTKLESISLQQNLFETKKLLEEKASENSRLKEFIQELELELRNMDRNKVFESLAKENKDLKETLERSHMSTKGTILGPLFSKLTISRAASDADLQSKMAEMSRQIADYELLVSRLKEELREEKLKAREEAEDLAQEMAELRYHLTLMLEDECKRRATVEQISLQRIAELEAQIAKERQKSISSQDIVVKNHLKT